MTYQSKWRDWEPKTPGHGTDTTDSLAENSHFCKPASTTQQEIVGNVCVQSVSDVSSLTGRFSPDAQDIRTLWNERVAIAEHDGGLLRADAEIQAWDADHTCIVCLQQTDGDGDGVRVSGGGWLHQHECYDRYFGSERRCQQ